MPLLIELTYADSTLLKYRLGWRKCLTWCELKPEVKHCLRDTFFVALYFNEPLVRKCKLGGLVSAYFGIRWGHIQAGLISHTDHPFVKLGFEGAKSLVTHLESNQKEPISSGMINQLVLLYSSSNNLIHIRFLIICLLWFTGFLRVSELKQFKLKK